MAEKSIAISQKGLKGGEPPSVNQIGTLSEQSISVAVFLKDRLQKSTGSMRGNCSAKPIRKAGRK